VDKNITYEVSSKYHYFNELQLTQLLTLSEEPIKKYTVELVLSDCTGSPTKVQSV
jgi:hypothetical protein